ncbi:MAG: hypothetical protein D6683_06880 [Actinomyces sp.]|nr:MAG: hypothetical protein D6683_06880 [Actinomyces sp.]
MRCGQCGTEFIPRGRHQKWCTPQCREANRRDRKAGKKVEPVPLRPVDGEAISAPRVIDAVRAELEAGGRQDTPAGRAALALAAAIDLGGQSGSSLAAMVRELRTTMAEAMLGAEIAGDPIDELKARREARLRGA